MHKNILTVVGITILFLGTCITPSVAVDTIEPSSIPNSNGKTLYVGGTGPNNYTTIQDAVDNASNGDTVFVYNGTYYENVRVYRAINLIGENKYTTIINGRDSHREVIEINTVNVKISGFTIQKSNDEGIVCYDWSNLIIEGNIIRDNAGHGICFDLIFDDCRNNIITNNIITNNDNGVDIELHIGPYHYDITIDITICNNIIINNDYGIKIEGSRGYPITNNITIYNNIITNNDDGIYLDEAENIIIRDNNITNNNDGIRLYRAEQNTIRDNTITNNNEGIILDHSDQNTISDNNIINNLFGLNSYNSIMNYISKNNFIGNMRNAYFSISWIYIVDTLINPNTWDSNYWDNWKGNGTKIIFGGLSREGIILFFIGIEFNIIYLIFKFRFEEPPYSRGRKFGKIPLLQFDRNPAKEPFDIEGVI